SCPRANLLRADVGVGAKKDRRTQSSLRRVGETEGRHSSLMNRAGLRPRAGSPISHRARAGPDLTRTGGLVWHAFAVHTAPRTSSRAPILQSGRRRSP